MEEFIRSYGLWILLGVIFVALHRLGMGCGGGHAYGGERGDAASRGDLASRPGAASPPDAEREPQTTGRRSGGCH